MRDLAPAWFRPEHQPHPDRPVEFLLRPLNMPVYWTLQRSMAGSKVPSWEGVEAAYEHSVQGWRGLPEEFSRAAKRDKLYEFDQDFVIWLGQIVGHLYRQALLSEDEQKNS